MPSVGKQTINLQDKIIKEIERLPDFNKCVFTEFEDEMIKKYYPAKGAKIARVMGKNPNTLRNRAWFLGVKKL